MQEVLGLILGGGRGARLFPLTQHRSEPAVPIAGKYRLIDIPISNCINSGVQRVYVLTQYLSVSLHRHIANSYKFGQFSRGFVEVLAAQQTNESADWYAGTADAIRQNIRYVQADPGTEVLVLCGDQLYRIDFQQVVDTHRESRADVTVAVLPVAESQARNYGIVRVDENCRITHLIEKPKTAEQLAAIRTPRAWLAKHHRGTVRGEYLANMGIYLFRRDTLLELLRDFPRANDIVTQLLVPTLGQRRVQAHLFDGYWEDVGSISSYFRANLALTSDDPPFDFHVPEGVIYTRMRYLPAARVLAAKVHQCLISDGCLVDHGAQLERCVLGVRTIIGKNAVVRDAVIMGANYYEEQALEMEVNRPACNNRPLLGIGEGSHLERVIVDKNCRIGRNVRIVNNARLEHADRDNYYIREGIVVIPNGAVIPDGTVI